MIFLDEPTTGLDPAKREDMWDVVRSSSRDGSTVLLTTQYLEEADALADKITVIDHGKVIAHDTPDGLKRVVGGQTLEVRPTSVADLEKAAAIMSEVSSGAKADEIRAGSSPCRWRAMRRCRRPWPGSRRPGSRSPSSLCTCRASTRCSSPSPAVRQPTTTPHARRTQHEYDHCGPHHAGRTPTSAAPVQRRPFGLVRHSLALSKRSLIKTWRTPEALIDVTLQPALFLVIFVYIFGGSVSGSTHSYLQFLLPGILAQTIATGAIAIGVNLNTDIGKGIFDRFQVDPIPRSAPLLGAVLGDVVRYCVVTISTMSIGYLMGFRIGTNAWMAIAGCLLAVLFALCLSWVFRGSSG